MPHLLNKPLLVGAAVNQLTDLEKCALLLLLQAFICNCERKISYAMKFGVYLRTRYMDISWRQPRVVIVAYL